MTETADSIAAAYTCTVTNPQVAQPPFLVAGTTVALEVQLCLVIRSSCWLQQGTAAAAVAAASKQQRKLQLPGLPHCNELCHLLLLLLLLFNQHQLVQPQSIVKTPGSTVAAQ